MLPTGMPMHGSQMPKAEGILSLIDQRIKDHLGAAGSQQALIPGVMHQGNPTALATGAFDGYNISDVASGLQRPTQGSTAATSCLLTNEPGSSYLTEYVREAKKLAKGSRVCLGSWNVGSLTGK
ncbi:hypothetical protein MKW92_038742 [Papaver armeniacum]|nr:hypothetical protein MKW92_038742 [Papaver armeniacum]